MMNFPRDEEAPTLVTLRSENVTDIPQRIYKSVTHFCHVAPKVHPAPHVAGEHSKVPSTCNPVGKLTLQR